MRVTIFTGQPALDEIGWPRMVEAVRFRLPAATEITIATDAQIRVGDGIGSVGRSAGEAQPADAWVIALPVIPAYDDSNGLTPVDLPGRAEQRAGKRLFVLEPHGLIHPVIDEGGVLRARMSTTNEPYLDEHVFSRLCIRAFRGNAYIFPYNGYYEALASAFGPETSFGFRIAEDLQAVQRRAGDVLLVAVFGGSSAQSPGCLYPEMFASQLRGLLDAHLKAAGGRFRSALVLNFGSSGATVINEMITYLLFAQRLRPDVIVAHDMFNDFAHGLKTDPALLAKYQITYLPETELWARQLMGTTHIPLTQHGAPSDPPFAVRSRPQAIVNAYLARKRQFMEMAERAGSAFVYGIQPAWFGKRLHPREARRMTEIRETNRQGSPIYDLMEQLYDSAREALRRDPPRFFADVHTDFARHGAEEYLFLDHAHLNAAGDRHVAEAYFELIARDVLPVLN